MTQADGKLKLRRCAAEPLLSSSLDSRSIGGPVQRRSRYPFFMDGLMTASIRRPQYNGMIKTFATNMLHVEWHIQ